MPKGHYDRVAARLRRDPSDQPTVVETIPQAAVMAPSTASARLPAKVRLTHPHGYIDDNDRHRYWHAGDVVSDPHEVSLLMKRGAPIEPLE